MNRRPISGTRLRAHFRCLALLGFGCLGALPQSFERTPALPLSHPAIQYFERTPKDPVAILQSRLDKGETKLDFDPVRGGYIESVLKHLGVNADSQVLVFSKTSFQGVLVSPAKPRAICFNDSVATGFVQDGDVIELASLDPTQGIVFYTLDVRQSAHPRFERRDVCLQCHQGVPALGVPGLVVGSSLIDRSGMPAAHSGQVMTDHRTPLAERWGGWFVEGNLGGQPHRGNALTPHADTVEAVTLDKVKRELYPARTSDVAALMTLEHQARMTNLLTRLGWETRIATAEGKLGEFRARMAGEIDEVVRYMLFADEAPMAAPIRGDGSFTKTFAERGPRDRGGRSLREFDLRTRLFRYPLSYMIYSEAFDALPGAARDRIYRRLYDVLSGKETQGEFGRLSARDRRDVLEIVRDTKAGLPAYWKE